MASPSAPVHPSRYLAVFLVLLIGVYLLARRVLATRAHTVLNVVALVVTVLAIAFFAYLRSHSK